MSFSLHRESGLLLRPVRHLHRHDKTQPLGPQVQAEGVVWWNTKGEMFLENNKVINNHFLIKHGG